MLMLPALLFDINCEHDDVCVKYIKDTNMAESQASNALL